MVKFIGRDRVRHDFLMRFAQRRIADASLRGVLIDADAGDLVDDAFLVALEGRIKWENLPLPDCSGRTELRYGGVAAPDPARHRAPVEPVGHAMASLCTVIRHQCSNRTRRQRTRGRLAFFTVPAEPVDPTEFVAAATDVSRAIAKLPQERRAAFVAMCIEDQLPAKYAEERGVAIKTARNNLDRAKQFLRTELADYRYD
jgi:DNA-directed RNA polymerase specialized sigma24 family protein